MKNNLKKCLLYLLLIAFIINVAPSSYAVTVRRVINREINASGVFAPADLPYVSFKSNKGSENIEVLYDEASVDYLYAITYAVPTAESYVGISVELDSLVSGGSLAGAKALQFSVRSSITHVPIKVGLQEVDSQGTVIDAAYIYIEEYLDYWTAGTWQTITIPLVNFTDVDVASVNRIVFVNEHDYADVNGYSESNVYYLKDFLVSSSVPDTVRLDYYNDLWGQNAFGGNVGSMGQHSLTIDSTAYEGDHGIKSVYNTNTSSGWAGFFMNLGGGSTGWQAQETDLSEYVRFSFWAKAQSSSENPQKFKVQIKFNNGASGRTKVCQGLTTAWQQYTVDFSELSTFDPSTITQIVVVYEKNTITVAGGDVAGVVYFDNFQFDKTITNTTSESSVQLNTEATTIYYDHNIETGSHAHWNHTGTPTIVYYYWPIPKSNYAYESEFVIMRDERPWTPPTNGQVSGTGTFVDERVIRLECDLSQWTNAGYDSDDLDSAVLRCQFTNNTANVITYDVVVSSVDTFEDGLFTSAKNEYENATTEVLRVTVTIPAGETSTESFDVMNVIRDDLDANKTWSAMIISGGSNEYDELSISNIEVLLTAQ